MNTHVARPASRPGTPELLRYLAGETGIAIAVNVAIGGVATWLLADPAALAHAHLADAAKQLVMPTLGPASALVPGITSLTRKRVARGAAPYLHLRPVTGLPHNLAARAVIIGLAALVLLGGPGAVLLYYFLQAAPVSFPRLFVFMLGYGAAFGLLVAPITVVAALADPPLCDRKSDVLS